MRKSARAVAAARIASRTITKHLFARRFPRRFGGSTLCPLNEDVAFPSWPGEERGTMQLHRGVRRLVVDDVELAVDPPSHDHVRGGHRIAADLEQLTSRIQRRALRRSP